MAGSLQSFEVASGAVSKSGVDTDGQDALHSAGVECSEDAGAHSKLPQPSREVSGLFPLKPVMLSMPCHMLLALLELNCSSALFLYCRLAALMDFLRS